jgi:catechol 2,3-dioxygenase-like lactoylglutathione lyase family enzyme
VAVTGLDHVVLHVSDWGRSNAFYRDVLGVDVLELPRGRFAYRLAGVQLNLHGPGSIPHPLARNPGVPGSADMCFEWEAPIEEAAAHLARHGIEVEDGPVVRTGARGGPQRLLSRPGRGAARAHLLCRLKPLRQHGQSTAWT